MYLVSCFSEKLPETEIDRNKKMSVIKRRVFLWKFNGINYNEPSSLFGHTTTNGDNLTGNVR
jgi:hypothetical protein